MREREDVSAGDRHRFLDIFFVLTDFVLRSAFYGDVGVCHCCVRVAKQNGTSWMQNQL